MGIIDTPPPLPLFIIFLRIGRWVALDKGIWPRQDISAYRFLLPGDVISSISFAITDFEISKIYTTAINSSLKILSSDICSTKCKLLSVSPLFCIRHPIIRARIKTYPPISPSCPVPCETISTIRSWCTRELV